MTYELKQPSALDRQSDERSAAPDTETLLAELGAFYPVMSFPAAQELDPDAVDETIFAGLVWP